MDGSSESFLEKLVCAVRETFEDMAFMETYPLKTFDQETHNKDTITAALLVLDPWPGQIFIQAPKGFLKELALDILGVECKTPSDPILFDLLAEILNTLSGKLISSMVPPGETFSLGVPEEEQEEIVQAEEKSIMVPFQAGAYALLVAVTGEGLINGGITP